MSGSVAAVDVLTRGLSLSDRTRSPDPITDNANNSLADAFSETSGLVTREIFLVNGEYYSGSLHGNTPEGFGVYVWVDGCKYEGEWRCGMSHGSGKLQWLSGTHYEGEFLGGYIHGSGTYTRADKMSYEGRWKFNLKHGLGYQRFPNGDIFEGSWIQGSPEGPGKYKWNNGNVYVGDMKGGKMSGKGTLTWTNGDSYNGSWLNGLMHGFGVYTWSDGSCYVGTWTRGLKDGKGTFYPKGSKISLNQKLYIDALIKQGLLPLLKKQVSQSKHAIPVDMENFKVGSSQTAASKNPLNNLSSGSRLDLEPSTSSHVPLERSCSLEVSIEKILGHPQSSNSSDAVFEGNDNGDQTNRPPIIEKEYMQGVLISELVLSQSSRKANKREKKLIKEIKRPGEQIIKGHRSYELMLSLQLGIRYTVGKITPVQRREVRATDFGPRASFSMTFPKTGSQMTPPHHSGDFKWKDYCPMVFRSLREMFKIDAADYMVSICGSDTLRELSSPGKSGSVFFLSQDDRFMIKTLRKAEVKVLLRMLPRYHRHVRKYENTLITKFFGLHRIKASSGQKFRFVVMGNVFCTELRIHRRFDLKGSSLGRSANKVKIDENTILKDLDLNYCFYLEPSWRDALLEQIEIDSKFLESENIMDYSLLLGVHQRAPQFLRSLISSSTQPESVDRLGIGAEDESLEDEMPPQGLVLVPSGSDGYSSVLGLHIRGSRLRALSMTGDDAEVDLLLPGTARLQIQLGVNMPARAERIPGENGAEIIHEVYDVVLYLGIIDILQEYNMSKKIEHAYKSLQFDSLSISAVEPKFYSQRFLEFIKRFSPRIPLLIRTVRVLFINFCLCLCCVW